MLVDSVAKLVKNNISWITNNIVTSSSVHVPGEISREIAYSYKRLEGADFLSAPFNLL